MLTLCPLCVRARALHYAKIANSTKGVLIYM